MVDHRSDALVDDAFVDEAAYEDACEGDGDDETVVVVPCQNRRPSSVGNAYVAVDALAVVDHLALDPYCAFYRSVVLVNDEDVVAWDRTMVVVNLLKNAADRQDVRASFQMDHVHDVEASFCTCVDVEVVDYHHDVDCNVVA